MLFPEPGPTIFKCFIRGFKEPSLLRIQGLGFIWGDGKKGRIEACQVFFDKMSPSGVHLETCQEVFLMRRGSDYVPFPAC